MERDKYNNFTSYIIEHPGCDITAKVCTKYTGANECKIIDNDDVVLDHFIKSIHNTNSDEEEEEETDNLFLCVQYDFLKMSLFFSCNEVYQYYKQHKSDLIEFLYHFKQQKIIQKSNMNFITNTSHEIKTPLNGIIGFMQLLQYTDLDKKQSDYICKMKSCASQLLHIINDMLDLSKLNAGRMISNFDFFNLSEFVNDIQSTVNSTLQQKSQFLNSKICSPNLKYIISDRQKLMQIIINLIINAAKYSHSGSDISLTFDRSVSDSLLKITVEDHGIGISDQDKKYLFTDFYQINHKKQGAGLGLSITRKLIHLLGGGITIESTPMCQINNDQNHCSGTKVTVSIPYNTEFCDPDIHKYILKHKVVLILDNSFDQRTNLSKLLVDWGMETIICVSPEEVCNHIQSSRFCSSLGILDVSTDQKYHRTVVDLVTCIKKNQPGLPLIAIADKESIHQIDGLEKVLVKPYNKFQLFYVICDVLKQKNSECMLQKDVNVYRKNLSSKYLSHSVLLVEDVEYNQDILIDMLKLLGVNDITVCQNGFEAKNAILCRREEKEHKQDKIEQQRTKLHKSDDDTKKEITDFDIIFVDLKMPILDGYELIKYIRKENLSKNSKIVVVTASVKSKDELFCKNHNVTYLMKKPVDLHELKGVLSCLQNEN